MSVQRTIFGQYLQTCQYLDLPFTFNKLTTLNTKLEVFGDLDIPPNSVPKLRYLAIGNGGHTVVTKAGGMVTFRRLPHRARHAALYNQLPFVMREINNDLSSEDRARYALRKRETHNGVEYFAYYLKRLTLTEVEPSIQYSVTENGVTTTDTYVPTNADINPEPPAFVADGTNVTRAEEMYTEALITVNFNQRDRDEFMEVVRILYNDEDVSMISELALCSAVDRQVTGDGGVAGNVNYNEAIAVQVNHHIQVFRSLKEDNNGFTIRINVGASDPMLIEE